MKDKSITNKLAIITGASGGLGREITKVFLENGFIVVLNYISSLNLTEATGDNAIALKADVSRIYDVISMADIVNKKWGKVDVLINNAGITGDSLLIRHGEKDWDRIMDVNLKGAFNCIKAFAPLMKDGGHIVNISSYSGLKGKEGQAAYSASKAALLGLTKTAAIELAEYKIKVNAILPGYMPTKMGLKAERALKRAKEESLLKTFSNPDEVARFILYLVSTENITGQFFCIDSRII